MVQLFQALGNHKLLQTFEIGHFTTSRDRILSIVSKEKLVLQKQLAVCSKSLMQLLNCASVKIEKLEIHDVAAFQDCSTCGSSDENAVKSLCDFLRKCKNIEYVDFRGCYLKGNAMQSILSSLSKSSTVSSIRISGNNSEICDRELVEMLEYLPGKCTFIFSSIKLSIAFKTNKHDLEISYHLNDLKGYKVFLTNIECVFPQRFSCLSIEVEDTEEKVLEYLLHNPNLKMITLTLDKIPQDKVVVRTENSKIIILKLCKKSLTSIKIKGHHVRDYGDILEFVSEGVRQNKTLQCMEIIIVDDSHDQTITGLVTLLNSLKSTLVQKLCFENIFFDTECTKALMELLSHNKHLTDLAMQKKTCYLTDVSHTPKSIILFCQTLQMKSLTVLNINGNKLGTDGTVALLDFLRLNPQLAVLKASHCHVTDDLFIDTHYWETSCLKELAIDISNIGEVLNETIISNKGIQYLAISKYSSEEDTESLSQEDTESLARALIQNLTLKEIRYGNDDNLDDLKREIQKLKRDKNVTISPDWNLKIREAD